MNKATFSKILLPLNKLWQEMDKKKKIRAGIIFALVILVIILIVAVLNNKDYVVLYRNLSTEEAGEVYNKLQEMNIDVKTKGGSMVSVPKKQEDTIRLKLAAEGYPKSGLNYDIFQNSTGFGTTDFEKQKYLQFQLQDRLQNSIKALKMVENAIVTLNMPDNNSFVLKADKQDATASVILELKSNGKLNDVQIKGIEGLVAKSVPGLKEENVIIIDNHGNGLKSNINDEMAMANSFLELEYTTGEKLENQVLKLLEPVFGIGNVTAGVRVTLDFDKKTTESVKYDTFDDGDNGIPISKSIENEIVTNGAKSGSVGQDANGGAPQYMGSAGNNDTYSKRNETVNYEINQIREKIEKAEGTIKDISVSVLIDENNMQVGSDQKVKEIVAGAIGVSPNNVIVQSMSFSGKDGIRQIISDAEKTNKQLKRAEYLKVGILFAGIGILMLLLFLFIFRPFIKRKDSENDFSEVKGQGLDFTVDEDEMSANKSTKREFIERNIKKNPELMAQLLRNWLNEEMR